MIQIGKLTLGHHYTTNWDMSLSSSNFCQKKDSMHFAHSFIMNGKNSHGRIGRKQSKRSGKTSCMRRRVREKIRIHLHFTAFSYRIMIIANYTAHCLLAYTRLRLIHVDFLRSHIVCNQHIYQKNDKKSTTNVLSSYWVTKEKFTAICSYELPTIYLAWATKLHTTSTSLISHTFLSHLDDFIFISIHL